MKANKTQPNEKTVASYLDSVENEARKADALAFIELAKQATGVEPIMWGLSIIGFGSHHYVYESGRVGDTAAVGFSARKPALAVYGLNIDVNTSLLKELGLGSEKGCIYIKKLGDLKTDTLKKMITNSFVARNT